MYKCLYIIHREGPAGDFTVAHHPEEKALEMRNKLSEQIEPLILWADLLELVDKVSGIMCFIRIWT